MASMSKTHDDYTIAWVCALPLEATAATVMLDQRHPPLQQPLGDENAYELGEIAGHNIVVVHLPAGLYGTTSAATVVAQMRTSFPSIRFAVVVGIGGGVPSARHDIRLGDVVVSQPTGRSGGVEQYDYGKTINGGFHRTATLSPPPQVLLTAMARLQAGEIEGFNPNMVEIVSDVLRANHEMTIRYSRPAGPDQLFQATYTHRDDEETCLSCDPNQLCPRNPRQTSQPRIHYGVIASGNQVMKDGEIRDRLAKDIGMLCFEMEAAGIMNQIPCLVIRGICDYSDSHKNNHWQGYAALTAAAYSKVLLSIVPVSQPRRNPASRKASWMVPFARNPRFLERENLVPELKQTIVKNGGPRIKAIAGLGGTGKTQIVLELAYALRTSNPEFSIFWIPAMNTESIEQAYFEISKHLGLQGVSQTDVGQRVKTYLSSENAGPWLLIIDNADDLEMLETSAGLRSFLPHSDRGFILVTARNRQLATLLAGPEVISVGEMDDQMAVNLLFASLIQKDAVYRDQISTELVRQLNGLPLAIVQAASYINETGISLESYLSLLHEQEDVLLELLSQDFEDDSRYRKIQNAVAATWLISFHQIQRSNPLAAEYLSVMACVYPRGIPQSLLPPATSIIQQQKALGLLKAYSFITGEDHDRFIHLHRLVHLVSRNWLKEKQQLTVWIGQTMERFSIVFPSSAYENRTLWRQYMPHAQFILQSHELDVDSQDQGNFLQNVAECLYHDGKYHDAEILFEKRIRTLSAQLPEDHHDVLHSKMWIALTFRSQGRWTEAEQLDMQVLETRKTVLGLEHPDTLTSMGNLASTLRNQGRWTEAEQLEVQVMETRKMTLGLEHPDTVASMGNLASTFQEQGKWTEAGQLRQQAMEIFKTEMGPHHPDTLTCMGNLAATFWSQGKWSEAEQLEVQVMETRKAVLGPEHPATLTSMANLAMILGSQGRWIEAEQLEVQVTETRKIVLGPEHPSTLVSIANLASNLRDQGRWMESEQLGVQVMEIRKTVLGPEHPDTLGSMWNLSFTLKDLGRYSEAVSMLETCVRLQKQQLGPSHPHTIMASMALEAWQAEEITEDLSSLHGADSNTDSSPSTSGVRPAPTSESAEPTLLKRNIFSRLHRSLFSRRK
jgi:nucleoside phosphorylase/tetratricopeptide (TPR) repeat protein